MKKCSAVVGRLIWTDPIDLLAPTWHYHIRYLSADGALIGRDEVDVARPDFMQQQRTLLGLFLPSAVPVDVVVGFVRPQQLLGDRQEASYSAGLARSATEFLPSLLIAHGLAVVFAWICYRRQVRYAARRAERWCWPAFVLAFGLPAWIGYRFGRSWPSLEQCPACGARVPQDRCGCAGCRADFPLLALRGTEVYA